MRLRVGFQPSITLLFVAVVLSAGLGVLLLSFERARNITRAAAGAYLDKVARHSADRVSNQFKSISDALNVLKQSPASSPDQSSTIQASIDSWRHSCAASPIFTIFTSVTTTAPLFSWTHWNT